MNYRMDGETDTGWMKLAETRIAGFPVVTASRRELVEAMLHDCRTFRQAGGKGRPRLVFDMNGQGISMSRTDSDYRSALEQADIIHCDGAIWVALSHLTGRSIAERSGTTDMMTDFAEACQKEGFSFYILGGTVQANMEFCRYLGQHYPGLKVAGSHHGFFGRDEEEAVLASINASGADVIWVGTGKPREQAFSVRIADRLQGGWLLTCGGCYNYFTGGYSRAPGWMQKAGLEWLHRMATQPSQFAWRYITTNPHSLAIALWDLIRLRLKGKVPASVRS